MRREWTKSAFVPRLRHRRNVALNWLSAWNGWHHYADLFSGLTLGLLQEVPECVNENVVRRCPLIPCGATNFTDPAYRRTLFRDQTNGGAFGTVRDVFLSWAHEA